MRCQLLPLRKAPLFSLDPFAFARAVKQNVAESKPTSHAGNTLFAVLTAVLPLCASCDDGLDCASTVLPASSPCCPRADLYIFVQHLDLVDNAIFFALVTVASVVVLTKAYAAKIPKIKAYVAECRGLVCCLGVCLTTL